MTGQEENMRSKICQHYNFPHEAKQHEHKPPPVTEDGNDPMIQDFTIDTDRTVQSNILAIIIIMMMIKNLQKTISVILET